MKHDSWNYFSSKQYQNTTQQEKRKANILRSIYQPVSKTFWSPATKQQCHKKKTHEIYKKHRSIKKLHPYISSGKKNKVRMIGLFEIADIAPPPRRDRHSEHQAITRRPSQENTTKGSHFSGKLSFEDLVNKKEVMEPLLDESNLILICFI